MVDKTVPLFRMQHCAAGESYLSAGSDRGFWRELCWTGDSGLIQILNIAEMDIPSFLVREAGATHFFPFPFDTLTSRAEYRGE